MKNLTLKIALLKQDITQRQLSKKSGIDEPTISRIATGRMVPDQQERQKIAEIVGLPEQELFMEVNNERSK